MQLERIEKKVEDNTETLTFFAERLNAIKDESMQINLEYLQKTLEDNGYTPDRFVFLCATQEEENQTVIDVINGERELDSFDDFDKQLILNYLVTGLANVTGRSPEEEFKKLHRSCGNKC